jgi:hypothetical protein
VEEKKDHVQIGLYDAKGSLVKTLFNGHCYEGETTFQFSTTPLSSGIYYLRAFDGEMNFKTVKLLVE